MAQDPTTDQLISRGKEAFSRNAYLAALEDFEEVVRREPGFADVHNLLGLCLSLLGRPDAAVESFDRAVGVNPGYVEAHLNRALTLNDLGRLDEARESFERAAGADHSAAGPFPGAVSARLANKHAELGDLYAEAGALVEAAEQYRHACRIRPRFLDLRNRLGRTLVDLGRTDEGAAELRAVLEANPSFTGARANLGLALYRSGDLPGAEAEWERCMAQQPGNAQVVGYLGMLRRQRETPSAG